MSEKATGRAPRYLQYLQDVELQTTSLTLPEEMREGFLWLGGYLRNECNRSVDILEEKMRHLGHSTSGSTIAKLIDGRYHKDSEGNPTKSPIIATQTFLDLVESLKKDCHLHARRGRIPFVETETWQKIERYIDLRRAPNRICKFGLIIGRTGLQKTECLKQYAIRNNHGKCVHVEAPESPSMSYFLKDLGRAYGSGKSLKTPALRQSIRDNVNASKTIIVDNIQRLYKPSFGWNQPIFSFLQKLNDDTGCTVIMCCVPEAEFLGNSQIEKGYFEQFVGRCGGEDEFLILPDFPSTNEIRQFAKAFAVEDIAKNLPYLQKIATGPGRLRVFFNVLQKAKTVAEAEGRKTIPIDLVEDSTKAL